VSADLIRWARGRCAGGTAEKFILVVLALDANERGVCLVSRKSLAEKTELTRLAVERALVTLEGRGLVARASRAETTEITLLAAEGGRQ
jgi:DNA-binding IclR family transcriptional regulator